jgi:hypothetical protein
MDPTLRGSGVRLQWQDLPEPVRRGIEDVLGAPVVRADDQAGGFSPGVAARVQLGDGNRRFLKVVGGELNPLAPELYRSEAAVTKSLPSAVPAPRILATYDSNGWVALVFEDVDGRTPSLPWRPADLERVVASVVALGRSLTPSPLDLPALADDAARFDGFHELGAEPTNRLDDIDPWVVRHLVRLADLHQGWATATDGETLLHLDIRADNVLLTEERVLFVDWPHACVGAAWIDLLFMLPSVAMQGGPPPERVLADSGIAGSAHRDQVTIALAGFAAFMIVRGRQPDPPGLPTLRRFQRAQAEQAVRWLRERTRWP